MNVAEAADLLGVAKWAMLDAGMLVEPGIAEDCQLRLLGGVTAVETHLLADFVLPPGRRGRTWLVLLPPPQARAKALTAAVLRAVR